MLDRRHDPAEEFTEDPEDIVGFEMNIWVSMDDSGEDFGTPEFPYWERSLDPENA